MRVNARFRTSIKSHELVVWFLQVSGSSGEPRSRVRPHLALARRVPRAKSEASLSPEYEGQIKAFRGGFGGEPW